VRARLEGAGGGAVFLCGDGTEVRAVLEAARDGGDVLGAGGREIRLFAQGRVDVLELLWIAHRVGGGARTPPSAAVAALASRVGLGRNRRGVCNGCGTTLF
jgi:hypothetical protein